MKRSIYYQAFPDESCYSLLCSNVLPENSEKPKTFFLNIDRNRIESITGKAIHGQVFDYSGGMLIPKFVNAHAHLELSGFAEPIPWNGSFPDWIFEVMKYRFSSDYSLESAIGIGEKELHDSGTGVIYDIIQPYGGISHSSGTWRFLELIAWNTSLAEENLSMAEQFLKQNRNVGLSPHAPYTICPRLLRETIRLSKTYKVPLAIHLGETLEEIRLLREHGGPFFDMMRRVDQDYQPDETLLGDRPLYYLELLAEADRCLVIHGNFFDEEEIRFLANHKNMTVVFCPVAHTYFEHAPYPIRRMLDLNVSVALGTDSRASWPCGPLSMIAVVNTLLAQYPEVTMTEALSMATTFGYQATGLQPPFLMKGESLSNFNVLRQI